LGLLACEGAHPSGILEKEALEFDVTHRRFAEFFPALGALLIRETDFVVQHKSCGTAWL